MMQEFLPVIFFFLSPLEAADFLLKSFPVNFEFLPDGSGQHTAAMCHTSFYWRCEVLLQPKRIPEEQ